MLTREFYDIIWSEVQQYLAGEITLEQIQDNLQVAMEAGATQLLAENPEWDFEV